MTDVFSALQHEMMEAMKLHAQYVQQIRLLDMIPPGVMMEAPLADDDPRAPGREVLIHPDDWRQLAAEGFGNGIEITMRLAGATDAEIKAERERLLFTPEGFQVFGIPIVDDSDAARARRSP